MEQDEETAEDSRRSPAALIDEELTQLGEQPYEEDSSNQQSSIAFFEETLSSIREQISNKLYISDQEPATPLEQKPPAYEPTVPTTPQDQDGCWTFSDRSIHAFRAKFKYTEKEYNREAIEQRIHLLNIQHRINEKQMLDLDNITSGLRFIADTCSIEGLITAVRAVVIEDIIPYQYSDEEIFALANATIAITPVLYGTVSRVHHIPGHWALAAYIYDTNQLIILDSLDRAPPEHAIAILQDWVSKLNGGIQPQTFPITAIQQQSDWSCGIFVLENLCYLISYIINKHTDNQSPWDLSTLPAVPQALQNKQTVEVTVFSRWDTLISTVLRKEPITAVQLTEPFSPPAVSTAPQGNPDPASGPLELLLAREWLGRRGCSADAHEHAHEKIIQEAAQSDEINSSCSSLADITNTIGGPTAGHNDQIPDTLDPKQDLMYPSIRRRELDTPAKTIQLSQHLQPIFEGRCTAPTPPQRLCMHTHHSISPGNGDNIITTYDIDSICAFPRSLAVAKHGIKWHSAVTIAYSQTEDLHLSLPLPAEGSSEPVMRPMHEIPNYCFGEILTLPSTYIWLFFPALARESRDPAKRTAIPREIFEELTDNILLPAIQEATSASTDQYYPPSYEAIMADARARREQLQTDQTGSPKQPGNHQEDGEGEPDIYQGIESGRGNRNLSYQIQGQYLEQIWEAIRARTTDHTIFSTMTLYIGAKNTKLLYTRNSAHEAIAEFQKIWRGAIDERFIGEDDIFIDLGRQHIPAPDTPLDNHVLLWRHCCLQTIARERRSWSRAHNTGERTANSSRKNFRQVYYQWATTSEASAMTITSGPDSAERKAGLVYTQYYNLIKLPFDAAKIYPFQSRATETLAIDPTYLLQVGQSTRGMKKSIDTLVKSYQLSKRRMHAYLQFTRDGHGRPIPNHKVTYGVRAEDRITMSLLGHIIQQDQESEVQPPGDNHVEPFFAVRSGDIVSFLRATTNRYCILFELVKAQTGPKYSLDETAVMIIALRSLRFCYTSGLLPLERVLWSDRSTPARAQIEGRPPVEAEGLGIGRSMKLHGFGWWRPGKFDWEVTRFHKDVLERLMVGTELLRNDYKRQWHAFQDIRDVHFRMWQAKGWLTKHPIIANPGIRRAWLDYLHCTVLELFPRDIWHHITQAEATRTDGNLADGVRTTARRNPPGLFYDDMKELFHNRQTNRTRTYPYIVAGNKMRTKEPLELVDDLFAPPNQRPARAWAYKDPIETRKGWNSKPYRVATASAMMMITESIDAEEAAAWYNDLCRLVLATNWILPWPSDSMMITKSKANQNTTPKMYSMWHFVSIISAPGEAGLSNQKSYFYEDASNSPEDDSHKMGLFGFGQAHAGLREQYRLDRNTHDMPADSITGSTPSWLLEQLRHSQPDRPSIKAEDLIFGRLMTVPFHRSGSNQNSFNPVFEEGRPFEINMVSHIRDRSAQDLDRLFSKIVQVHTTRQPKGTPTPNQHNQDIQPNRPQPNLTPPSSPTQTATPDTQISMRTPSSDTSYQQTTHHRRVTREARKHDWRTDWITQRRRRRQGQALPAAQAPGHTNNNPQNTNQ
ncbi:unnamed protein product [Clonostachys rosea f. rosea IK726]|uniref:Uncharacterized protein n=1 Tax=Clonostachys rosea f. rosea IK726 TaxID=1349383 RepID=A0ACA9UFC8_BIOOC|nr:unnamed protein product [Clonostachys rosea f. rosea IK726]